MTMPNAMKIFTPNFVDENSEISVSSGSSTSKYLNDNNRDTYWESDGEGSDTDVCTIEISFKNDVGGIVTNDYDYLALLNTNWGQGTGQIVDSTNNFWTISALTSLNNTDDDFLLETGDISIKSRIPKKIILYPQYTIDANEEKKIGEIMVMNLLLELNALTTFSRSDESKEGDFRTHDGALVKWREFTKFGGQLEISNLTKTQRDILQQAFKDYLYLTYAFYDEFDVKDIYTMALASPPLETLDRKTQLYSMSLTLKQK